MKIEVDSFFKVMQYHYTRHNKLKLRYPTFRVYGSDEIYFKNLEEVEKYMEQMNFNSLLFEDLLV